MIPTMSDTERALRHAEKAFRTASAAAEAKRLVRNQLVATALVEGLSHRQIAAITGLSRARINQLKDAVTTDGTGGGT